MIDNHDTSTIDFLAQRPRTVAANDLTIDLTETHRRTPAPSAAMTVTENSNARQADISDHPTIEGELVPAEENSNVRQAHISDSIITLATDLGVNVSIPARDMIAEAAHDMANSYTLLVRTGVRLALAKAECQHGEFENYCNSVGISRFRAAEAVRYADLAARLDTKERERYLMLPRKSALLLANVEPALVELLLEDENLELTKRLRKRSELSDLARALTEAEDELEQRNAAYAALEEENLRLRQAHEAKVAGSEYPLHVVTLRKESSILADEANACLSSIRTHVEEFLLKAEEDHSHAAERNFDAGLMPALANLVSVLRSGMSLLNYIEASTGVSATDTPALTTRFSPVELELIEAAREDMLARKEGKSLARQSQYAANGELKRNRGRPKKLA